MPSIEKTGKTVEDAIAAALQQLGVERDQVEVEVLEHEGRALFGILGHTEARVRVTTTIEPEPEPAPAPQPVITPEAHDVSAPAPDEEPFVPAEAIAGSPLAEEARDLLARIVDAMGITAQVRITSEDESSVLLEIVDEEQLGLVIGRYGQTIAALQSLVGLIINRNREDRKRIIVDAQGYRARRERSLQGMAHTAARRVKETGQEEQIANLSAYERRIIHTTLQDDSGVTTYSIGEEPHRQVVIAPKQRSRS